MRYWSLMRMLCCPLRSPVSTSNRFPAGFTSMSQRLCTNVPETLHQCPRGFAPMSQRLCTNVPETLQQCSGDSATVFRGLCIKVPATLPPNPSRVHSLPCPHPPHHSLLAPSISREVGRQRQGIIHKKPHPSRVGPQLLAGTTKTPIPPGPPADQDRAALPSGEKVRPRACGSRVRPQRARLRLSPLRARGR
jgi:hypothetical protein